METEIINGCKSWWGKFPDGRAISFASKWCSGWNPQLGSHYVTDDQKLGGRGGSLSVCITPHTLHLNISFWPHSGYRARGTFAFLYDDSMAILPLRFSVIKIDDWSIYLFSFVCFSTLPLLYHAGDLNVGVHLSLAALQNGRGAAQSPFTRVSSPWEESAGLGRALRDFQPPSFSSRSVWCPEEMAMQRFAGPALPLPALPELAASGLHLVLMTKAQCERKIKPLSVAKPSSPYSTLKWSLCGLV